LYTCLVSDGFQAGVTPGAWLAGVTSAFPLTTDRLQISTLVSAPAPISGMAPTHPGCSIMDKAATHAD
jgi:hypothetical protein